MGNDNTLIVIRAEHNKNYKVIDLTCVNDHRLSWKAKGIFNYFITKPPQWKISMADLKSKSPDGSGALTSGINELIKYGYIFRIVKRTSSVIQWSYLISEIPCSKESIMPLMPAGYTLYISKSLVENPLVENPLVENPLVENPLVENRPIYSNKEKDNNKEKESNKEEKVVSSKEETSKADALPSASNKTILHKRSNGKLLMNAKLKVDKPLKAKKPIKPYQPTEQALDLIEFWEGKGLKSISHNPETKTYEQSLIAFDKLLSGKAFNSTEYKSYEGKKFTLAEARKAISRFALMALNPDYEPRNVKFKSDLSKISPADFIFNAYVSSNGYGRSKFIHCHENEAKIIREKDVYVEDKYPNVTKAVMNKYKKDILGGSEIQFTNDDLNAFRKAANFAYELFAKNQNRLLGTYAQLKPYQIAESMFEALERGGADFAKVKPHWLCNGAMQKQLPAYLYQAAILQDRTCEGQQQVHYYDFGRPFSE
jgi:hypothetical protein